MTKLNYNVITIMHPGVKISPIKFNMVSSFKYTADGDLKSCRYTLEEVYPRILHVQRISSNIPKNLKKQFVSQKTENKRKILKNLSCCKIPPQKPTNFVKKKLLKKR